ncbi:MAG TPA: glycosyltransferase [Propionicimonas sp.]|jgi:glycosyltransferase involved in cell wall biosynthesis|uniref:glycosyltransferase family 2 protein n=1 Tax=Propionicimonas sp. TaxID=1955623 RepID=UPI002F40EC31
MSQPLVSVLVPVLDVAGLLPRCLDSLLAQTHRPLEILVVNDGSSDASADVIDRYAALHPEVRAIHQEHRGLGPARNAALAQASGEYVAMVDADDWVEPDFLSDTVRIARATGADVVVTRFWFVAKGVSLRFPFGLHNRTITGLEAAELSLDMMRFPAFAWNKLYRRDLFLPGEQPFPNIFYEDLATTPRLLVRAATVALTRRAYYRYCLRSDSITGDFGPRNVFGFAAALAILREALHELGLWEAWYPSYRKLLRSSRLMMAIQVLLQRNRIPVRRRGAILARFGERLRALAHPRPVAPAAPASQAVGSPAVATGRP